MKTKLKKYQVSIEENCSRWVTVCLLGILFVAGTVARAQQITGGIAGTVKDDQGALVAAAEVKASNTDTGFTRSTVSDSGGSYTIQYLPVGNYTVTVGAPGFKKFVQQNIVVAVDQTQSLPVALAVGAVTETITVTTAPPLGERDQ